MKKTFLHVVLAMNLYFPVAGELWGQQVASDSVHFSAQEWADLEVNLEKNPYYLFSLDRPHALALIRGGIQARPSGLWVMEGIMLCTVEGQRRRQLTGDARVAAYRKSVEELQEFYAVVAQQRRAMPDSSMLRLSAEHLQESLAEAAVEAGAPELATSLATALLKQNTDSVSQNYGRIVHNANQVLGRVALRRSDLPLAKRYLLMAGRTPGGPGLAGYGPSFYLARELLERGEKEIVLQYLELVSHPTNDTYSRLHNFEQWKKEIREGRIPSSVNWY